MMLQNCLRYGLGTALLGAVAAVSFAQSMPPEGSGGILGKQMGITQRIGEKIPLDLYFKESDGTPVEFGDVLGDRPAIVVPVYYECLKGCRLIEENLIKMLAKLHVSESMQIGRDFELVFVSIDPTESLEVAARKKNVFLDNFEQPETAKGWHLLVGNEQGVAKFADAIGFKYHVDPKTGDINHPIGSVTVASDGTITAYTIGDQTPTKVIVNAIDLAKEGKLAPPADQSTMFGCVTPPVSPYRNLILSAMQILGALTILGFIAGVILMSRPSTPDNGQNPDSKGGPEAA